MRSPKEPQKMFRMNVCGPVADSLCGADAGTSAACSQHPAPHARSANMTIFPLIYNKGLPHWGARKDLQVKGRLLS